MCRQPFNVAFHSVTCVFVTANKHKTPKEAMLTPYTTISYFFFDIITLVEEHIGCRLWELSYNQVQISRDFLLPLPLSTCYHFQNQLHHKKQQPPSQG